MTTPRFSWLTCNRPKFRSDRSTLSCRRIWRTLQTFPDFIYRTEPAAYLFSAPVVPRLYSDAYREETAFVILRDVFDLIAGFRSRKLQITLHSRSQTGPYPV